MRKGAIALAALLGLGACDAISTGPVTSYEPEPYVQFENAEWTRVAVRYQLNTRQFTSEGTFVAA
ncbi:MAG: alpha-amylase, partial [Pseudomonadota bacterium]